MKNAGSCLKFNTLGFTALMLIALCFGTSGCAFFRSNGPEMKSTEKTIWHSRLQNVKIVRQDTAKGSAITQNEQPVLLVPEQIRNALASLEVRLKPEERLIPVFSKPELDTLSGKLSQALTEAEADQDVTFVSIGDRKAVYGLTKQPKVTTARVFYKDGKLNIIFGRMVEDISNDIDTRLFPLTPGSRIHAADHKWILEESPDIQFHAEGGMIRSDWVMLDLASMAAHEALGIKPAAVPERVVAPQETRQVQAPAYQAPVVTQAPQTGKTSKTIEERLQILNDLKNKKLITDEEYKKKRADILNDL
jgi:hypothetical protein